MQFTTKKKVAAVLGAGAVAVAGSGIAFAYWTSTGDGTGTASATSGVANLTDLVSGGLSTQLFPGQAAQSFNYTVHNTSGQSIYISTVKAYVTVAKADGVTGTCSSDDFKLDGVAGTTADNLATLQSWAGTEIADGVSVVKSTSLQFNDLTTNQDGCKGASLTVHYLAS